MKKVIVILVCLLACAVVAWELQSPPGAVPPAGASSAKASFQAAGTQNKTGPMPPAVPRIDSVATPEFKAPTDPLMVVEQGPGGDANLFLIGLLSADVPPENAQSPSKDENAASNYFATKYFLSGARFRLYHGGSPAGEAIVTGLMDRQCDAQAATARSEPALTLGRDGYALATNNPHVLTHANEQREPTKSERSAALDAARKVFAEKGVSAEELLQIVEQSLVATVVDQAGSRILVGWFEIAAPLAGYKLFLILGGAEDALQVQYVKYETLARKDMVAELSDWPGRPLQIFVDQLDLDGDGVDELVTEEVGYEGGDFIIYKRKDNRWFQVFHGGEGGC